MSFRNIHGGRHYQEEACEGKAWDIGTGKESAFKKQKVFFFFFFFFLTSCSWYNDYVMPMTGKSRVSSRSGSTLPTYDQIGLNEARARTCLIVTHLMGISPGHCFQMSCSYDRLEKLCPALEFAFRALALQSRSIPSIHRELGPEPGGQHSPQVVHGRVRV